MQPAALAAAAASAMPARSRPTRTAALLSGGFLRLDRRDNLTLLQRYGRLLHDRFVAAQSVLNIDRRAEVAAEHHRLKVQLVARPDDGDARAMCGEGWGGRRDAPARPGRGDLERHVREHPWQEGVRLVRHIHFGE